MGEHGRVGSEIINSNGDQQINLGGRIDVDILMGIERERSQISDWKNGQTWENDNDSKIGILNKRGNAKWECQHWTGNRN